MKRSSLLLAVLILALAAGSAAGGWFSSGPYAALENANTRSYLEITVSSAAVGFSAAQLTADQVSARYVRIAVEGADIRYRDDGGVPSATAGTLRVAGEEFVLIGSQISQFKAIRTGAADAVLHCTVYF
jgi:hypothetical protein